MKADIYDTQPTLESVTTYSSEELLRDYAVFVQPASDDAPTVSLQSRVAELEDEVLRLRGQLERAKEVNDVIWQTVVQKVVAQGKEKSANGHEGEQGERSRKRGRTTA